MYRKRLEKLIEWKDDPNKKPLIIKGVRQCGKTYLIKEFGKKYYEDVAYFNFEANEKLHSVFENDLDTERIILELGLFRNKPIIKGRTLMLFDEIQFCNKALTSLKYFNENSPEYHIVCAGSLLGIALSKPLSFPVGKVDLLTLYPMSFQEFILANGEEMLCQYLQQIKPSEKISDLISDKLINYLKTYYITGGMPEVIEAWIRTKDVNAIEEIQQNILDSYELDFAKHAPISVFPKLTAIWRSIPAQLAKDNKKFIFGQVKKGLRAKDLEDALEWLVNAGLAYKICKIEKPFIPLSSYADQTFFKLYISDIGLLRKMAGLPASSIYTAGNDFKEFKGALTENYVLCELMNSRYDIPFFWKSKNIAEVDFIVQTSSDIIPVEVKSETNVRAKSLAEYRKKYDPRISVKTSMKPLSSGEVTSIPLYLISEIDRFI